MNREKSDVLELIFAPTIAVMDRLRYGAKFGLMGVLLLIPILVLSYYNTDTQTSQVEFNFKEHLGVDYCDPLKTFMGSVQKHRMLRIALLSGDTSFREEEARVRELADASAAKVSAIDAKEAPRMGMSYGKVLQTTDRWKKIESTWNELKSKERFANAGEADAAYESLTAQCVDLILNYVANYSNLILDPDLDSYWLMDAYVTKLPLIAQTISKATTAAVMPTEDPQTRQLDLAGYLKVSTGTMTDLRDINMATTYKETVNPGNPNRGEKEDLKPNLDPKVSAAVSAVNGHAEQVIRAAFNNGGVIPSGQLRLAIRTGLSTLNQVYAVYDQVTPELDYLILKRTKERYENPRTKGLIATVFAVALLVFLFAGFFLSVRSSVSSIGAATRRIISGTNETFVPRSRDELGNVLNQYNEINAAVTQARRLQAQVEADNARLQANIMDMLQVVSTASDGDLTVRARVTEGAMGNVADAFNQLLESLQRLIGEINQQQLASTEVVKKVRDTIQQMAQGASTQAAGLSAANKLIERMNVDIELVSSNAGNASDAAKRTAGSAVDGSQNVGEVIAGMDALRQNVQAGAKKMKSLGDRSMEITTIVSVINRISEQTNMLALNAAIEAARAGEHGRGFSVVAEEVRKLAERTAQATREIDKLVKAIQAETNETVAAMETQTEVVEKESKVVSLAGESLGRIRDVSERSSSLVAEISRLARDQVEGARSVLTTMNQISSISQQTEAGAKGAVNAMMGLVTASEQMAKSIRRFKLS
jgi:methyl-accepting chemotaxis protein